MSGSENEPQEQPPLGLWSAVSIIVSMVIGTTIFKMPWLIFANTSDPGTALLVWLLGGVLVLIGGFCYAELATTYPRDGGDYHYLTKAFRPWVGFLFGWGQLAVLLTASIGAMAVVFGENATLLFNLTDYTGDIGVSSEFLYAVAAVLLITVLNQIGVKLGAIALNIITVLKLVGMVAIIVAGFWLGKSNPVEWEPPTIAGSHFGALAMILVLYAYGGWNDAAFVAAEVRNPKRNIPRALILGIGAITVLYLLVNAAYLVGLGFDEAKQFGHLPQKLLEGAMPGYGGKAITILVLISALGSVNGLIFAGARVYSTMGRDHALFAFAGQTGSGKRAPIVSLLVQAVFTIAIIIPFTTSQGHDFTNQALAWVGAQLASVDAYFDRPVMANLFGQVAPANANWNPENAFDALVSHTAPVFWLFFLLTGFSLFILRDKNPGLPRPYSVPLYPLVPMIFCATCCFMLYRSTIYVGYRCLFGFALVLLGLPLYGLSALFGGYTPHESDESETPTA
jgi:APA family basic amino acid/polyamine antiporter